MYYIFQPKINFKKETDEVGDFEITMMLNNLYVETKEKLTDEKIETIKTKCEQKLKTKFGPNITLELTNIIQ